FGLIAGAVCCTLDELLVFGEELVFDPIHRHRHMAAAVDVRVELPAVMDGETFLFAPVDVEKELLCLSGLQLTELRHDYLRCHESAQVRMEASGGKGRLSRLGMPPIRQPWFQNLPSLGAGRRRGCFPKCPLGSGYPG